MSRRALLTAPLIGLLFVVATTGTGRAADSPSRSPAVRPAPPPPPAVGFGAPRTAPDLVRTTVANPMWDSGLVTVVRPVVTADAPPLPVVLVLHGFGSRSPDPYLSLIEHLARRGAAVVFPLYPALDASARATRYDTMWSGYEAALRALAAEGVRVNPRRLGVVGHSFGGGAAPAIAARAQARGHGADGLFIACLAPWYDLDLDAWAVLPPHTLLLVAVYADDSICDPAIGTAFLDRATTVAPRRKALRVFVGDAHGRPRIKADHLAPITLPYPDTMDTWGTWRALDALAQASGGDQAALDFVVTPSTEALSLGTWSDGTPVAPAQTTWTDTLISSSRRAQWRSGGVQEVSMRRLLRTETASTLPLADPVAVPVARWPAAERFVDRPPRVPPPADGGLTPRLLVEADAPPLVGEDRLTAAGVRIERVRALPEDAPALVRGRTAMLCDPQGRCLLWRTTDDPRFCEVALAMLKAASTTPATPPTPDPVAVPPSAGSGG